MSAREYAHLYTKAGYSVIPIRSDGSKAPAIKSWKEYQDRIMTPKEIDRHFFDGCGVAIVCGPISGNLEVIDVEGRAKVKELVELIDEAVPGLLVNLPQVRTPSGGLHIYVHGPTIGSNQKLAMQSNEEGRPEVLIETRGEGGYVLAPGSPAECHKLGNTYELINGSIA